MDRGREFEAEVRKTLFHEYGITRKMTTPRNPQANSMVKRAHQTVHNMIATLDLRGSKDLKGNETTRDKWDGVLAAVGFAMRATVHTITWATPMQLVFGQDALTNVQFQADWDYIKARKTKVILQNNKKENAKRLPYTYTVDCVYENGTLGLRQETTNGGMVYTTWNIRNIHPYKA